MSRFSLFCCLALSLLLLLPVGCRRAGPVPAGDSKPLTILYTCDTEGLALPVACDGVSEGGLARRERYVSGVAPGHRLLVDAGDFSGGPGERAVENARFILQACDKMGYHAVNLGHREAGFPRETIEGFCGLSERVISANLVDAAGNPVARPYVVTVLEDGTCVGIIGIMDDTLAADRLGAGLRLLPPDTALGRYMPKLRAEADVVVLLAFADAETMMNLASLFAEIDIAIGGRVERSTPEALRLGHAVGAAVTGQGRAIGRLELSLAGRTAAVRTNTIVTLSQPTPDEVGAEGARKAYEESLKARAATGGTP